MASDGKPISGVENIGRCVDLVELDPLDVVSSCKIIQAILPEGGDETYSVGEFAVPKGIEVMSPFKLTVSGGETLMSNSYDFTHSFEKSITVEGGFEGLGFNASETVKKVQKDTESREDTFTYVYATSAIHVLKLDLAGVQSEHLKLNKNLIASVKQLPDHEDDAYSNFIKEFGTHFLSQVALGGMAWSRVSTEKIGQTSSKEVEAEFKAGAKAEIEKFTGGISKTEARQEVQESDKKRGITRSQITCVGGTGDVSGISSTWVSSLDEKSVPIHEKLVLTRLSSLLTERYFADDTSIANKKKVLDEATSRYIRQKGGDEGERIRYGHPVQLRSLTGRKQIYCGVPVSARGPLYAHDPAEAPSGVVAKFGIHGPLQVDGEEVMAGDPITLKVIGTDVAVVIEHQILPISATGGEPNVKGFVLTTSTSPKPEGEYLMRIIGSGQEYQGQGSTEKKRPLVSGDIVMISRYDQEVKKFAALWVDNSPPNNVRTRRLESDPLFSRWNKIEMDQYCFVVSNA